MSNAPKISYRVKVTKYSEVTYQEAEKFVVEEKPTEIKAKESSYDREPSVQWHRKYETRPVEKVKVQENEVLSLTVPELDLVALVQVAQGVHKEKLD